MASEAVIVIGNKLILADIRALDVLLDCAGHMINDGHHLEYYTWEPKAVRKAAGTLHTDLRAALATERGRTKPTPRA